MKLRKTQREVVYTLELTETEARFLFDVMTRVSGDPDTSRRYIADSLMGLLDLPYEEHNMSGYIHCEA